MWNIAFYTNNVMVVIYTIDITTVHGTCDGLAHYPDMADEPSTTLHIPYYSYPFQVVGVG